jgi:hypothetical protein
MLHMELPHVNVLSKVDLVPQYGQLGECPRQCMMVCCYEVFARLAAAFIPGCL